MINAREKGFTLIELLITLTVVTVLLATAVPYMGNFAKNNRLITQTNDLVLAIQLARSEAVKRGINTVICPSTDQSSCSGNAADWQTGWLVFSDTNLNGSLEPGASAPLCEASEDCLMRTGNGLSHNNTLTTTATTLRFLPTGMASNGGNVDLTIVSNDCYVDQARNIRITSQGHTIVSTETCP
jgi:type IV fimbrial biogenesis protein FimT